MKNTLMHSWEELKAHCCTDAAVRTERALQTSNICCTWILEKVVLEGLWVPQVWENLKNLSMQPASATKRDENVGQIAASVKIVETSDTPQSLSKRKHWNKSHSGQEDRALPTVWMSDAAVDDFLNFKPSSSIPRSLVITRLINPLVVMSVIQMNVQDTCFHAAADLEEVFWL